jgi:hypothetical protein
MRTPDEFDERAKQLLPCVSGWCGGGCHVPPCPFEYRPAVAAALREAVAVEKEREKWQGGIAEREEYLNRCSKELGDAGILITEGPLDGIVKLINERDDFKRQVAELQRGYTAIGVEAWPCPGCHYEDGKFIEACGLHKQLATERERALTQLLNEAALNCGDYSGYVRRVIKLEKLEALVADAIRRGE